MGHVSAIVNQQSFRGRNDDGTETGASWKQLVNIDWSQNVDENFRTRFLIQETAGGAASNLDLIIEYNLNGGGWAAVGAATPVQFVASGTVTDGTATTQQLGAGTFVAGEFDSNGTVATVSLSNDETEMEYSLTVDPAQVANNDTFQVRVTDGGSALDAYTNTPTVTVLELVVSNVTASQTEDGDTTTAALANIIEITSNLTEDGDTTAAAISAQLIAEVTAAQTESGDTTTAALANVIAITANQTESGDTTTAALANVIAITAGQTEVGDTTAAAVSTQQTAELTASQTEVGDTTAAAISAQLIAEVTAAQTESGDTTTALVSTLNLVTLTANQVEAGDITSAVLFAGQLDEGKVFGVTIGQREFKAAIKKRGFDITVGQREFKVAV